MSRGPHNLPATRRTAFTLVELMVSIAIALLLIIGVNEVFKIGAQTVGAGQAFSAVTRDERTGHTQIYTDIHNCQIVAQPALIFTSQRMFAFRNLQDQQSEPSGKANTLTINGVANAEPNSLLGPRNYRIDTLGFFASGDLYQRQTGNADGNFLSSTTSSNAYIWYGHLALPNNAQIAAGGSAGTWSTATDTNIFDPGATNDVSLKPGNNDNNYRASEWILGRVAMLLDAGAKIPDIFYTGTGSINPLAYGTTTSGTVLQSARYDLVGNPVSYFTQFNTPALRSAMALRPDGTPFRYEANPFPVKPLNATNMAAVAPIFLNHCSQFIVEYAGDYLTQVNDPTSVNYGAVAATTGAQGDNVVDFVVDKSNDPSATGPGVGNPALWTARVRWYGFPRDTSGEGAIDMQHDVVPLRDVLQAPVPYGPALASGTAPWEVFSTSFPIPSDPSNYNYVGNLPDNAQYICSWGSEASWPIPSGSGTGLPRMLRITVALDDPSGRLAQPQFYEYVIDLGSQQ